MLKVIYHAGKSIGFQGYATISVFLLTELASLIIYIINVTTQSKSKSQIGPIADIILQQVLYGMLFYYAYQMKVVQIKLESEDYYINQKQLSRAKNHWIFYYSLLIITLAMDIFEKLNLRLNANDIKMRVLTVSSTFLSLSLFVILAYLQWSLFMYFIEKKKQRLLFKTQMLQQLVLDLSPDEAKLVKIPTGYNSKTKFAITVILSVLIVNSANLLIQIVVQILITINVFKREESCVFEWYTVICIFWVDILILTNGLCFLLLFKNIAKNKRNIIRAQIDHDPNKLQHSHT